MKTVKTSDDRFEDLLRDADPLPAAATLSRETVAAMRRTSGALASAMAEGDRARRPSDTTPTAAFAVVPAPWGVLHVAALDDGIVGIELRSETAPFVDGLAARLGGRVVPEEDAAVPKRWRRHLDEARRQLGEYFAGTRSAFELEVDLSRVSEWDRRVLTGAARLDFGELTSYGALARMIGKPGAARAVGGALGRNPIPIVIPCHRIVAADGTIGGYGRGGYGAQNPMLAVKRQLLKIEGCAVPG